ncbi:MAG: helix-turn-helix transcriptional regulator [Ignavibacteria bacterium]
MTQEALASKSGTTKFYISRIENNGSDKIIHSDEDSPGWSRWEIKICSKL